MREIDVALLGFGNVGRAFADYVGRLRDERIRLRIRAIADRSGGLFIKDDEALQSILIYKAAGRTLRDLAADSIVDESAFISRLTQSGIGVLVESLPTNLRDGQPAFDLINSALTAGLHVVTVDKGPLACGFDELQQTALSNGVRLGFTGTTGVGIPDELTGERILEILLRLAAFEIHGIPSLRLRLGLTQARDCIAAPQVASTPR